jgi:hypothetical protein
MELLSALPACLSRWICSLASLLDRRTAPRLAALFFGLLLAAGRRTVTSWFRPAGITDEYRPAYHAVYACGRRTDDCALVLLYQVLRPLLGAMPRLVFALDDTPTRRYGPCVEGAGIHRNPTPGPANAPYVYGHIWVTLALLAGHPLWGTLALPLLARLYVRHKDIPSLPREYRWPFRTKLELAVELLAWLVKWLQNTGKPLWLVADGGYAKKPFLKEARRLGVAVVSRLRKDAALWTLPPWEQPAGKRGPKPKYGDRRIDLPKRAGQRRGWQRVECVQYGEGQTKRIKTFLATWPPAGGAIRVVLVKEAGGWLPFFSTDVEATAEEILTAMADRGAIELAFRDLKEVWGAGQQQLRNLYANIGAYHMNLWALTMVEAACWDRPEEELIDRRGSPWDEEWRRPSAADKRRAIQREILGKEIEASLRRAAEAGDFQAEAERLFKLARGC